ncbi:LysR family transcriptional regulator [Roseicyclus sp.]|uniref:LysR family transcriptional regulator n=1 Tax=Roseicyclus sp. TaxID=1914329 RepID=UPI003F9F188E
MEMSQIRYVLAAARALNFTRAAEECHVTQPALTKGIKALETELGANLFLREGRRVLLSEFGRSMLPHLRQIAEEAEAARTLAQSFRLLEKAPLRLGVLSTIGHMRLARFLARLQSGHPGMELAVSEGPLDRLREDLDAGRLDAAILSDLGGLGDSLRLTPLYEERYVVVIPPQHRLGGMNAVTLHDLSGENYVDRLSCEMREMVMRVCDGAGVSLYARFRSEREDWVQAMVLAGIGFAFMPEYSVSLPGLIQRPLVQPEVARKVALATMPGRPHAPATAALVRAAQSFPWPG